MTSDNSDKLNSETMEGNENKKGRTEPGGGKITAQPQSFANFTIGESFNGKSFVLCH